MFAFHIDSGEIDGTAVEDRSVVLLVHIPQAQATDGNWKLGLYVDERASGEQAEKLPGIGIVEDDFRVGAGETALVSRRGGLEGRGSSRARWCGLIPAK